MKNYCFVQLDLELMVCNKNVVLALLIMVANFKRKKFSPGPGFKSESPALSTSTLSN